MLFRSFLGAASLALAAATTQVCAQAAKQAHPAAATVEISETKPEAVGFSSERLGKLDGAMKSLVDSKKLAGVVTVLARHGKIVEERAYGYADVASQRPMQKDTIVRIYSMTKPITGIAMMMLYEEGKWKPSDPIARYIPEFRDLKVYSGVDKDGKPTYDKPGHAPTMGELMSHTAGFTYGVFGSTPVDKMYQEAQLFSAASLQDFIERVAKLPLVYQPGEGWVYSVSVDIQGYLVEKLSGKSFPDFLRERIFLPSGHEGHRLLRPCRKARSRCDHLSRRCQCGCRHAQGSGNQPTSRNALGRRGPVFHCGRLSALRANGAQRRGVERGAPGRTEFDRTHAHESRFG